jgi:hypothetical protein
MLNLLDNRGNGSGNTAIEADKRGLSPKVAGHHSGPNCCCRACEPIQEIVSGLAPGLRLKWWLGMYQAFLDDSGRGSGASYVIAGFLASVEGWLDFASCWQRVLDMPPALAYFKMKDAMHPTRAAANHKSPFFGWPKDAIDETAEVLTELTSKLPMRILIRVPNSDWDRIYSGKIGPQTNIPFLLAHFSAMQESTRLLALTGITEKVNFIFDTALPQEQHWVKLAWHFWKQKEWLPERKALFGDPPDFRDDKIVLPLQAADLYAWHARKAKQMESEGRDYDHAGWKLLSTVNGVERDWTAEDLEKNFGLTRLLKEANKWAWPYDKKPARKRRPKL